MHEADISAGVPERFSRNDIVWNMLAYFQPRSSQAFMSTGNRFGPGAKYGYHLEIEKGPKPVQAATGIWKLTLVNSRLDLNGCLKGTTGEFVRDIWDRRFDPMNTMIIELT